VTWPGAKIQKQGEGMPNYDNNQRKGILYITFDVDFPRGTFSDEEEEGTVYGVLMLMYPCTHACNHHLVYFCLQISSEFSSKTLLRNHTMAFDSL